MTAARTTCMVLSRASTRPVNRSTLLLTTSTPIALTSDTKAVISPVINVTSAIVPVSMSS